MFKGSSFIIVVSTLACLLSGCAGNKAAVPPAPGLAQVKPPIISAQEAAADAAKAEEQAIILEGFRGELFLIYSQGREEAEDALAQGIDGD